MKIMLVVLLLSLSHVASATDAPCAYGVVWKQDHPVGTKFYTKPNTGGWTLIRSVRKGDIIVAKTFASFGDEDAPHSGQPIPRVMTQFLEYACGTVREYDCATVKK